VIRPLSVVRRPLSVRKNAEGRPLWPLGLCPVHDIDSFYPVSGFTTAATTIFSVIFSRFWRISRDIFDLLNL
jgi:hypothetical protein